MNIYHITFTDQHMTKSAVLSQQSAFKSGAISSHIYGQNCYDPYFFVINRNVLIQNRGVGYWIWKPYIILKKLHSIPDNSYLVYSDAGVEFIKPLEIIINSMDQDIMLFGNNYRHLDWCKMDVMDAIIPDWRITYNIENRQSQASVIIIKNNKSTRDFVKEWGLLCQMPGFIDDTESKLPNYATFQEHRHDQAILTCLAYKYAIKLHWWPAQYNNGQFVYDKLDWYCNDNYPVMFHHHRKRNNEW